MAVGEAVCVARGAGCRPLGEHGALQLVAKLLDRSSADPPPPVLATGVV